MVATGAELRARRSEVVNRHVDAENRHDPDGVVASVNRPRYGIQGSGRRARRTAPTRSASCGRAHRRVPRRSRRRGPHLHADEAVSVEVTLSGTHQGEWAGIPATGRRASVRIACLYEFDEDRLVCEHVWSDFATIMRQLGVLDA